MSFDNNSIVAADVGRLHFHSSSKVADQTIKRTAMMGTGSASKTYLGNYSRFETGLGETFREAVEKALIKLDEMYNSKKRRLNFYYDRRIDKIVVKVIEGNREKIIRQIPSEEFIRLSLKMDEIVGLLINQNI